MTRQSLDTLYLGAAEVVQIVRRLGLSACIATVAELIEADLRRWSDFQKIERMAHYSAAGAIELMPISDGELYAFKYVNGHPGNTRLGLPTVMAFGLLAEVATGKPLLLAELTLLTAIRTAAMSALAARLLARPDSRRMALIGNGAQSEFQALAFHHLLGIEEIRLFDIDRAATAKLTASGAGPLDDIALRLESLFGMPTEVRMAPVRPVANPLSEARGRLLFRLGGLKTLLYAALSDVEATLSLARLLRRAQPRLLDHALGLRRKASVLEMLDWRQRTPLIHVSQRFPAEPQENLLYFIEKNAPLLEPWP